MPDANDTARPDLKAFVMRAELTDGKPGMGFDVVIRVDDSPLGRLELQVHSRAMSFQELPDALRRELSLFGQQLVATMDSKGVGFARH